MGSFLQMGAEQKSRVERVVSQSNQMDDFQRESVLDLLQGKETAQSSGEITGMLKAMLEEMEVRLSEASEAIGSDHSAQIYDFGQERVVRQPGSFKGCSET